MAIPNFPGYVPTDQEYENSCQLVHSAVEDLVRTQIAPVERELDADKLQKKIYDYLKKSNRSSEVAMGGWQCMVDEFTTKFYSTTYHGFGDKPWLDKADFSLCVALAIKGWKPEIFHVVPQEDYMNVVGQACTLAHDTARYFSYAWMCVKKAVPSKVAQKKVQEAVDKSREVIVKQHPTNIDLFISSWVQQASELLAKDSAKGNPKHTLPEACAVKMFDDLIQKGGVPLWLEACKPEPNSPSVASAVNAAYAAYPEPTPPPAAKGKGKGEKGDGKGCCKGGFDQGFNMAQQMMAGMMGMMAMGGGMPMMGTGGMGGKGWGPY